MKIYISGPITGVDNYLEYFAEAENFLSEMGVEVTNPATDGTGEQPWSWYMRRALKKLLECDVIFMLHGWEKSKGAKLEKMVAEKLEMPIMYDHDAVRHRSQL